jgi:hypothetical protein
MLVLTSVIPATQEVRSQPVQIVRVTAWKNPFQKGLVEWLKVVGPEFKRQYRK